MLSKASAIVGSIRKSGETSAVTLSTRGSGPERGLHGLKMLPTKRDLQIQLEVFSGVDTGNRV